VFQAGADGVAVAMVVVDRERDRNAAERHALVVVGEGIAALHIEQPRTPGVADAAGHRAEPALIVVIGEAAGEYRADIAAEPAVLSFGADHPVRSELVIRAALQTAEETAVAVVARAQAVEIIVARECAADMAADIEAGPVVDRRRIDGSLGIRSSRAENGCKCWHGRADRDARFIRRASAKMLAAAVSRARPSDCPDRL